MLESGLKRRVWSRVRIRISVRVRVSVRVSVRVGVGVRVSVSVRSSVSYRVREVSGLVRLSIKAAVHGALVSLRRGVGQA